MFFNVFMCKALFIFGHYHGHFCGIVNQQFLCHQNLQTIRSFLKYCSESEKVSGGGVVNFCSGCFSESGKGGTVAASKSKRIPCSTNIYDLILQRICLPYEPIQVIFFIKF